MKKAVALLLAFVFAFAPYPTAFAVDSELPPDPRIEVVEVNSAEEIPEEEHEIPVRVFYPKKIKHDESIIYIHGGGWALGTIDTYTNACMNLAEHLDRPVYLISYRLAPEHPYPAGFNDCLRAIEVLLDPAVPGNKMKKWVLMGDSAGGNLAAAVSLKLKEDNKRLPDKQILPCNFHPAFHNQCRLRWYSR